MVYSQSLDMFPFPSLCVTFCMHNIHNFCIIPAFGKFRTSKAISCRVNQRAAVALDVSASLPASVSLSASSISHQSRRGRTVQDQHHFDKVKSSDDKRLVKTKFGSFSHGSQGRREGNMNVYLKRQFLSRIDVTGAHQTPTWGAQLQPASTANPHELSYDASMNPMKHLEDPFQPTDADLLSWRQSESYNHQQSSNCDRLNGNADTHANKFTAELGRELESHERWPESTPAGASYDLLLQYALERIVLTSKYELIRSGGKVEKEPIERKSHRKGSKARSSSCSRALSTRFKQQYVCEKSLYERPCWKG